MQIFYFQKAYRLPALILAVILLLPACKKEDVQPYLPQANDQAIIFTHKFQPGDYEAGKSIVIERFSHAIETSGQTRRTYFISRPDSAEVVAISFFHPNSSTDVWLNSDERDEVLALLQPLYREPLQVRQFSATRIHDSHLENNDTPAYFPEKGDEVILFYHQFNAQGYELGKDIVINDFPSAIENSGQIRRTYFLEDPAVKDMMAASFFHPESGTEAWLNEEERAQVLASLQPFYREPLQVRIYTVDKVHDTH